MSGSKTIILFDDADDAGRCCNDEERDKLTPLLGVASCTPPVAPDLDMAALPFSLAIGRDSDSGDAEDAGSIDEVDSYDRSRFCRVVAGCNA